MKKLIIIITFLFASIQSMAQKVVKVTGGDSAIWATKYTLDTTRNHLYAAIGSGSGGTTTGAYDSTRKNNDSIVAHNLRIIKNTDSLVSHNARIGKNTDSLIAHNTRINAKQDATNYVGTIYNSNVWSTLGDFVNNGTTSTAVSNRISASVTTAGTNTATLDISADTTALEYWHYTMRFKASTAQGATTYGLGIGIRSINSFASSGIYAYVDLSSASHLLNIVNTYPSNNTVVQSTSALSYSTNDSLEYVFDREGNLFTFSARNMTTNSATIKVSGSMSTSYASPAPNMPNTGRFAIYTLGGTYTIDSLNVTSKEVTYSTVVALGDSKTVGYFASWNVRWATQLKGSFRNLAVLAGGGDRSQDILARVNEVIRMHPKYVLLESGTNDPDSTTTKLYYPQIVTALTNAGITVYNMCFYQSTNLWRQQWLQRTYPSFVIDTYTPLKATGALSTDNMHPSSYGDSLITNAIIASQKLTGAGSYKPDYVDTSTHLYANTNHYVPYSNGSTFANSPFYYDQAGGFLGIGTTSPFTKIDIRSATNGADLFRVQGTSNGNAASPSISVANDLSDGISYGINGSGYSAYGALIARSGYMYSPRPIVIMSDGASNTIAIAPSGNTTVATFKSTGLGIGVTPTTDKLEVAGNIALTTAGNKIKITEGSNGSVGQTTLVAGVKAITITGLTASSRVQVTFVSIGGTVTTTWQYAAVCTANTLTITALTSAGTTNTSDTSVLNYFIVN